MDRGIRVRIGAKTGNLWQAGRGGLLIAILAAFGQITPPLPLLAQGETPAPVIILQNGTRAEIKNGQLIITAVDGKQSSAPPGTYVTRDGRQLTVESDGRLSPSTNPVTPQSSPPTAPRTRLSPSPFPARSPAATAPAL